MEKQFISLESTTISWYFFILFQCDHCLEQNNQRIICTFLWKKIVIWSQNSIKTQESSRETRLLERKLMKPIVKPHHLDAIEREKGPTSMGSKKRNILIASCYSQNTKSFALYIITKNSDILLPPNSLASHSMFSPSTKLRFHIFLPRYLLQQTLS